ncbi:MAG TPA: YheC/YheD family protein [Bacilli bacterium]|nr:YheC/YheD family protein [Bacilli bacterium]
MEQATNRLRIESASPARGRVIYVPAQWLKDQGIHAGEYRVSFGVKEVRAEVRFASKYRGRDGVAVVSQDLARSLCLPNGVWLAFEQVGERHLRFGDLFALLANVKANGEQVKGQQAKVFRNLLQAAEELSMFGYVFAPQDIEWEEETAVGYYLGDNGLWQKARLPLPDVVYDQIISRRFEKSAEVASARGRLKRLLPKRYFNPGYFDKWQVHGWLAGDSRTRGYVPETIRFQALEETARFVYTHPEVYMKPMHGSLGVGIMRVRRLSDGRVFYQRKRSDGQLKQGYAGSITQFLKTNARRLKRGGYLTQKALHLQRWNGRPFDIRLLLQKDGTGKWQRTKSFCRVAQEGEITSNLSTGGDAFAVKQVLKDILQNERSVNQVMKELRRISEDVPAVIEAAQDGVIGELGLDLGLDEFGRIWVIEVNAKPWKKPNTEEGEWKNLALLAFQRPVMYAKHLCSMYRDRARRERS